MPKIHKFKSNVNHLSLCPVVSSLGTYNDNLTKFLSTFLKSVICTTYCTKDSFSFCGEIKKVRASNKSLVSFYFCNFFTFIPSTETINIALDLLFEKNSGFEISKADLKMLFQFATLSTHFMFEGRFYYQVDGVVM